MSSLTSCIHGRKCKDVRTGICQFSHPRCTYGINCKRLAKQKCPFYHTKQEHFICNKDNFRLSTHFTLPSAPPKRQFQAINNFGIKNKIHLQNKNQLNDRQKLKERRELHIKQMSSNKQSKQLQVPIINRSSNKQSKQLQVPIINRSPNFNLRLHPNFDQAYSVWEQKPFAEGACRYAYAGLMNCIDLPHKRFRGDRIVVKKWKNHHVFKEEFWDKDLKCYKEAGTLINIWNKMKITDAVYELCIPTKQICNKSYSNINTEVVLNEWVITEDYLAGQFIKWNSNSGYVRDTKMSIHAFCHWTYHYSKGNYVMCDAQGTHSSDLYRITDPCICSKDQCFGATDLGQSGIVSFFANHSCNSFCGNWIKPKHIDVKQLLLKRMTSTYQWDVPKQQNGAALTVMNK